jgi:tetratricopeptide (TPR) repeat protein
MILRKPIFFSLLIAIGVWGVLIYSNTFRTPFLFDDEFFILKNPAIRNISSGLIWHNIDYRKRLVSFSSFALNYHLNGLDVFGYHLFNLTVHVLTAFLVVWLVLLLFKTPVMQKDRLFEYKDVIALLSGWLFVSHPLQTESVTYISQRFESLATLFYFLSICLYLKARMGKGEILKNRFFWGAILSAVLGMFTKETVFTLPFALILMEWVFFDTVKKVTAVTNQIPKTWVCIGIVALLAGALFPLLASNLVDIFEQHAEQGITSGKYLLTQFRVIPMYLGLLLLPLRQNLDYDLPLSSSLFEPATLAGAVLLLVLILLGFKLVRRYPLLGFGIIWFFLTISISSSIIPLMDFIFEHRVYLPSLGFVIVVSAGLFYVIKNPRVAISTLAGFILFLSFLTYQRNAVWGSEVTLWKDTVAKSPQKTRPYVNLGKAYKRVGDYEKAEYFYRQGLEALKYYKFNKLSREKLLAQVFINLGALYGEKGDYKQEIRYCRNATTHDPQNPQAYSNIAYAYNLINDNNKAFFFGKKVVEMAPNFEEGLNNLGVIYGNVGKYDKAAELFERALQINPYFEQARINLHMAEQLSRKKMMSSK